MPERASYSLFPPSEEVLRRQHSKRASRARTPSGTLSKRSTSAHSSVGDNHSIFEENKTSSEIERAPASKSTDDLASQAREERRNSTLQKLAENRAHRRRRSTELSTIYSPPPDATEHKTPLTDLSTDTAPPPSHPLPSVARPSPTIDTKALKPPSKRTVQPNGTRHARNPTNSTVNSTTKPSPITPESQTSAVSLFTPITPPSAGPSPVKYPAIPRLSSSPAPPNNETWTMPRRSHSRSTNHSQTTTADLIASYAHMRDGSYGRTVAPSRMQRAPSNATSARTGHSHGTATPRPSVSNDKQSATTATHATQQGLRSMFPTYNPAEPLQSQEPRKENQYTPQFHLPAQRIESKPYPQRSATPSLTREALEAHNAANDGDSTSKPDASEKPERQEGRSKSEPTKSTVQHPPRSQSLPQHNKQQGQTFLDNSSVTSGQAPQSQSQKAPTFPPPPRRETSVKSSRTRALLTKPRPPPKDDAKSKRGGSTTVVESIPEEQALVPKKNGIFDKKQKTLDFQLSHGAYRAATSATTKYDKDLDAVTTTATTTIVNVPNQKGPLHASTQKEYAEIIDGKEFKKEDIDLQHQHSVAVALGAVAFVMGAGVELVGGAVNSVKGGVKPKKR
ncbi:MAG: hypothetical protein Q9159_004674 [Coniocarpon cinnabarinum]